MERTAVTERQIVVSAFSALSNRFCRKMLTEKIIAILAIRLHHWNRTFLAMYFFESSTVRISRLLIIMNVDLRDCIIVRID